LSQRRRSEGKEKKNHMQYFMFFCLLGYDAVQSGLKFMPMSDYLTPGLLFSREDWGGIFLRNAG
jgi:hypothetical protein